MTLITWLVNTVLLVMVVVRSRVVRMTEVVVVNSLVTQVDVVVT